MSQELKHCETCDHRVIDLASPFTDAFLCRYPGVYEDGKLPNGEKRYLIDHMMYPHVTGSSFYVGSKFGCIHHTE